MPGCMQRPLNVLFAVVLMTTLENACQKKQAGIPVPPAPTANTPDSTAAPTQPSPTTTQPTTTTPSASQPPPTTAPATPAPTEEQPKPSVRRPPQRTTPANPGAPPNATPAPNQPPRLGTLLTPEQQKQFNNDIDRSLRRAQSSLHSIGNRQLTADQHERVVQVESFIQQAQAARRSNLAGAKSLAERAEVLARDLVASLR